MLLMPLLYVEYIVKSKCNIHGTSALKENFLHCVHQLKERNSLTGCIFISKSKINIFKIKLMLKGVCA